MRRSPNSNLHQSNGMPPSAEQVEEVLRFARKLERHSDHEQLLRALPAEICVLVDCSTTALILWHEGQLTTQRGQRRMSRWPLIIQLPMGLSGLQLAGGGLASDLRAGKGTRSSGARPALARRDPGIFRGHPLFPGMRQSISLPASVEDRAQSPGRSLYRTQASGCLFRAGGQPSFADKPLRGPGHR